ncbi:MAG TPA: TonB-dependent receptor [Chitinophagaceae bacterium]|nr:TonB-dependent receptor [Chitinophagaceae bacterium]
MRKLTAVLLVFLFSCLAANAQSASIKGTITDTLEKKNLSHAVIVVLTKKDSSLISFARSDNRGIFSIPGLAPGDYLLMVTYPGFADYADDLSVQPGDSRDLGVIAMTPKSKILQEVVIRTGSAIRIKGDTTEFTADSFHVKDGATVEDLLKVLPGFTVNSKGEITAQGKRVDKVLVDGEEFFGDDPTVATQNLGAKIVDKVQIFDTKTDQDKLKGIGGGSDTKTLNIKLKEDAKKGYFGKLEAGTNLNQYTDAKALFNRFVGKKKLSLYGTKSTTSTGSLGWDDRNKLGIENDYEYDEIGGYYYSFGTNDDFSNWSLQGLPNAYSAGGLYSDKWNGDINSLNLNYRYNRLGTTNVGSTLKQTLLQDTTFYNNESTRSSGVKQQHVASGKYDWKIDSLATLTFRSTGTYKTSQSSTHTSSEALDENHQYVNTGDRTNDLNSTHKQLDNQLTYNQLFHKKGRQLIATFKYSLVRDDNTSSLFSNNQFFKKGILDSTSITDQSKIGQGDSRTFGTKVTYNEPLTKFFNLVSEYSYNDNHSTSHLNTYEKDGDGKYTVLDPLYSNNFDLHAFSHTGTVTLRYLNKKLKYAFGGGLSAIQLRLNNLDHSTRNIYNFTNFTPQAQISYNLKAQTSIGFRYNGTTRQPTLDQLQPIRNNNDPLNIQVGNPNLKVGFNHSFNAWYNSFKILSSRYIYMGAGYNILEHSITTYNTIDSFGKVTSMPVNVNGNNNWYLYSGWQLGQGDKKLTHGMDLNLNGGRNVTFINGQQSINSYASFEVGYRMGYSVQEKYNFSLNPQLGRSISSSSLRKDVNNNYWTYGGQVNGFLMLPGKVELNSDVNFDLRQKISAFDRNTNIIVWNASLGKKVFKDKSGKFIFTANDLLNQNKGYSRIINSNFVTDQRYQRVGQYFMLTFQWTFSQMPGKN